MPRSTGDIDIVIAPTASQLRTLIAQFPKSDHYADERQALEALATGTQFNIIDFRSGWKVDFIIAEDALYGRVALGRRRVVEIAGVALWVASPEDVILAKLRWAKLGGSERQLQDAAGIIIAQHGALDFEYIERWVRELHLELQWQSIRDPSG